MPFTKPLLIASLIVFSSSRLASQINFTRQLYSKLAFEDIALSDSNGVRIQPGNLADWFFRTDTAVNCFGDMIDRFYDLQYADPQFIVLNSQYAFDTLPNERLILHYGNRYCVELSKR